jgi:hypothetical protein
MRFQIGISSILLIITSAVLPPRLRAQLNEPQVSGLTRGATHERRTSHLPGLTAVTSACPISDDPSYGATPANPIKVGGGAMYVMARSMRFLETLRGPAGQGLHVKRLGSFDGPDDTILDVYQLEYDGAIRQLYIDGYRFSAPKAPLGLVCGASMPFDPPGPDPLETRRQLIRLAATLDATAAGPISLDPDGSAMHGVIFDHIRLVGKAFAAAAATGRPLDVNNVPGEISRPHFLVVAYPLACNSGSPITPQSVKVSDANGNSPRAMNEARGEQIRGLVPGVNVPASALAVMYDADLALPGQVEIQYATACGSSPPTVVLPLKGEAGRITHRVAGRVPSGVTLPPGGAAVRVQVYFDFNGAPRFPVYAGGPGALADAAVAAVSEFRADPPRVNGAPLLQVSMIAVAFQP